MCRIYIALRRGAGDSDPDTRASSHQRNLRSSFRSRYFLVDHRCNKSRTENRVEGNHTGFETRLHAIGMQACVHSRLIARIGYHRNVRGAASLPIHP
jgi:hypothetical protein